MKESTLEVLRPVLNVLRSYDVLEEIREATFTLDGRDFVDFHDQPDGLWADVRLSKGQVRLPVSTPADQAELIGRISEKLDLLRSRKSKYRKRPRPRHR